MSSTSQFNDFHRGNILNNLNGGGLSHGLSQPDKSRPKTPLRLSPRVMLGVELNLLKPHSELVSTKSHNETGSTRYHNESGVCKSHRGSTKLSTRRTKSHSGSVSDSGRPSTYQHGVYTPLRVTTEVAGSRPITASTPVKGPMSPALRGTGLDSDGTQTSSAESHSSDTKFENQLQAYMLWINSQLKKKPGARLVEDLRNDTRDGVAFIDLIHVIAREDIPGVHVVPSTFAEMRDNIERVLHFMASKKIRMHHIQAKDIVDGNLKSIMRLILALAAHYKPKSVKHSSQNSAGSSGSKSPNVTGIAQGASAALAQARRTVAKAGSSFRRKGREFHHRRSCHQESSSDQYSDSDQSFHTDLSHSRFVPGRERGDVDGASAGSSPTASSMHSPQSSLASSCTSVASVTTPLHPVCKSRSADPLFSKDTPTDLEDSVFTPGRDPKTPAHQFTPGRDQLATPHQFTPGRDQKAIPKQHDDLMTDYIKLAQAMNTIKKELSSLQDLLLTGEPPDGEESAPSTRVIEGTTPVEQIVILRSQLQQSQDVCSDLREELSKGKLESMQAQGVKGGLQQRLTEQEATISQLKQDLLRMDFQKQNFDSDKSSLLKQIQDKEKLITDLRRDISRREQRIDQLQHNLQVQATEKETVTSALKSQLKDLNDRFRAVDESGATLKARVATQDKQMAKLAGRILHTKTDQTRPAPTGADEMSVLRDSLSSLRQCFTNADSQQHTIDTLEQGITSLMERIPHSGMSSSSNNNNNQNLYDHRMSRKLNFDSTGDVRRSPITAIPGSKATSFNPSKLDAQLTVQATTKVLYFTDNITTPSMLTICKRLGEITLKDFKAVFDRQGHYRYHFKALDPEFGTVKEEISNEDAIIPGWEGKIVAWIEEDAG